MADRAGLPAIHDDDLETFLESIGMAAAVRRGDARCRFCDDEVSMESIGAVFPAHGHVFLVCGKASCLLKLLRERDEARNG